MARENADPGDQNGGEEKPQVLLDAVFAPPHDTFNQQKRKETTKRASAFVILAIVCIWFLLQPLHKERGPVSIGVSLIGLFGFMAFVWAAAMMVLVGE